MICYFHKFKKSDPLPAFRFGYRVVFNFNYNDFKFGFDEWCEHEDDPIIARRQALELYRRTQGVIEFLIKNLFFTEYDILEYDSQIYSRINNSIIQILGGGENEDLMYQRLEYYVLDLYNYISKMEPTSVHLDEYGMEYLTLPINQIH